eukprot:2532746-Rhodomonas_salina.5
MSYAVMSGTDIAYVPLSCYAHAMRCPVLRQGMLLSGPAGWARSEAEGAAGSERGDSRAEGGAGQEEGGGEGAETTDNEAGAEEEGGGCRQSRAGEEGGRGESAERR